MHVSDVAWSTDGVVASASYDKTVEARALACPAVISLATLGSLSIFLLR
jgi:hypothetical protein